MSRFESRLTAFLGRVRCGRPDQYTRPRALRSARFLPDLTESRHLNLMPVAVSHTPLTILSIMPPMPSHQPSRIRLVRNRVHDNNPKATHLLRPPMPHLLLAHMRIMPLKSLERLIRRRGTDYLGRTRVFDFSLDGRRGCDGQEFSALFDERGGGEVGVDAVAEF